MTNTEKQLSADLHSKLGVVSGWQNPHVKVTDLGDSVRAKLWSGRIVLTVERDGYGPYQIIELKPETFQALEHFAESVGWRCD